MAVSDIISVIPPPPGHGWRAVDWASVEQSLGLPLPQDYKDFIAVYGPRRLTTSSIYSCPQEPVP